MPLVIVVAAQKKKFALPAVEASDPGATFVERLERGINRCQQNGIDSIARLETFEQFVAYLLRTASDQFGVMNTDKQNLHRGTLRRRSARSLAGLRFISDDEVEEDDCIRAGLAPG